MSSFFSIMTPTDPRVLLLCDRRRKGDFRPKNVPRVCGTKKSAVVQKTTPIPPIHPHF